MFRCFAARFPCVALRSLSTNTVNPVVCIDYSRLINRDNDLSAEIEKAYGHKGLGILTVSNIPGFTKKRETLLPMARQLGILSETEKKIFRVTTVILSSRLESREREI